MLTINIGPCAVSCKPENRAALILKLEKASKIKKPGKPGAEKRKFPNGPASCYSTAVYVESYLRSNGLKFVDGIDGYIANDEPTTWPDGPEVEEFHDESMTFADTFNVQPYQVAHQRAEMAAIC